ncbi:hypothetical protein [Tenacibaculum insulae]|uniref:hypothetical protein n=1 Tax=Tenacibaculum insulae TaxID=2029677 RepID=UPI003AB40D7C
MRFLVINLIFILFFAACSIPTTKNLQEYSSTKTTFTNPYFSDINTDYVYKAKIKAYNNVFGGILIIKKIDKECHRIVFTTNFGNKIFDFQLNKNDVKTHYIMDELNRKIIINILTNDFKTLTKEHHQIYKTYKKNELVNIYQTKTKKRFNHYFTTVTNQELTKIVNTTKTKEKVSINFNKIQDSIAKHIVIQHKKSPIKIDLTIISNN